MRKLLILSLIAIAGLGCVATFDEGTFDFKWKSSSFFPNDTIVHACIGDNVTFPWFLDMTSPNSVSIEWTKIHDDQNADVVVASYSGGTFYELYLERNFEFLPNAGIKLPKVTLADTGYYKVEVIVLGDTKLYKQAAFLQVSGVPVTDSVELHAFMLPERVYNSTTGRRHIQLGCRSPAIDGQTALPVIWTTPSKKTLASTSYDKNFLLTLPVPLEEGNYTCSLNTSVPTVQCFIAQLNTSLASTVEIKGVNTRLLYLERSVQTIFKNTTSLNDSLCELNETVQVLQDSDKKQDEEIANINQKTENTSDVVQDLKTRVEQMTVAINLIKMDNSNELNTILALESKTETLTNQINNITALLESKTDDNVAVVRRSFDETQTAKLSIRIKHLSKSLQSLKYKFDYITTTILQQHLKILKLFTDDLVRPTSCQDVQAYDSKSGIHTLFLSADFKVKVYCDQSTDNGGWTVFQRRQNGSVNFIRNWATYEKGFGDLNGDFWLGLRNLHHLTEHKHVYLRIDLTDFDGSTAYVVYSDFRIADAHDNYRLHALFHEDGNAGDSLGLNNKALFSTYDRDNSKSDSTNCARTELGGWWYQSCSKSNLNGRYKSDGGKGSDGVTWYTWKSDWRSLKRVEMKIKY